MTNPMQHDSGGHSDAWLRAQIAAAVGPPDLNTLSDGDLYAMLDACRPAIYDESETERMVARFWAEVGQIPAFRQPITSSGPVESAMPAKSPAASDTLTNPLPLSPVSPSALPKSPILGFLSELTQLGGGFTPTLWSLLGLVCGLIITLSFVVVLLVRSNQMHGDGAGGAQAQRFRETGTQIPLPGHHAPKGTAEGPMVTTVESVPASIVHPSSLTPQPADRGGRTSSILAARLVRMRGIRWGKGSEPLREGGDLLTGQKIRIAEGLAEIDFFKGMEIVLQGPAVLTIEADDRVFLAEGRLSALLTRPEARGFTVRTPKSMAVDEGTEFGVDVIPGGDESVHVFQGKVQFSANSNDGKPVVQKQLTADQGARVCAVTGSIDLLADTGEGFTRTMADLDANLAPSQGSRGKPLDHDPHTVAYWRFEDRPVGTLVPDSSRNSKAIRGTVDSSGNGNDLFTWGDMTAPRFSADVPMANVPQTGHADRCSLDYSAPLPKYSLSRELYTRSEFSHASPIDIQKISPRQWTIEASVKPASLNHERQTFVGRGGDKPWAAVPSRLACSVQKVKGVHRFVIAFYDADGRRYQAVSNHLRVEKDRWYHVAATSDGRVLRLYVDANDGKGFSIRATTQLAADGNTALGMGSEVAQWTVGRGLNDSGKPAAWFQGFIDEVRISDVARTPAEFLFAPQAVGGRQKAEGSRQKVETPRNS